MAIQATDARTRDVTKKWLKRRLGLAAPDYMRRDHDRRGVDVAKCELLARIRTDGFDPRLAIDDRNQVVRMWGSEGLVCAQIAEGEF